MKKEKRLQHGTLSGYKEYRCRCRKCAEVWELYTREFREEIFDERTAKRPKLNVRLSSLDYSEKIESYDA